MSSERYERQMILPELGEAGQLKLSRSSVLICGVGGLGSPNAFYLAALGIGRIGLLDGDTVSPSNLNRQILYREQDIGQPKVSCAAARLRELNSTITIEEHCCFLCEENARQLVADHDIIVDCFDNFAARLILNDACVAEKKPFVHAGVYHLYGQTMTVIPGRTPCLRCLFPNGFKEKQDPAFKGIIGATVGVLASMQALEVYKYLLGLPVNDQGLLTFDGLHLGCRAIPLQPSPDCICQKAK